MINLMYLVLTALLALNVSAEVMNAFFTLDKGNQESISTVNTQLDQTVDGLKKLLGDDSKAKYKPIEPAVDQVRSLIADFNSYVDELRDEIVDVSGNDNGSVDEGDFTESYGKRVPKGKKNKDVTTNLLVNEGKGEELKEKIIETKDQMIKAFSDLLNQHGKAFGLSDNEIKAQIENVPNNLPFGIDDETWRESVDKDSWSDFKFRQMPVAAVLPLLSQMQSDAKSSEAALVNKMAEFAGGRVIEFDAFFPVVEAKKAYVIKGEPFEAKISVGTYSTQISPTDINLFVNGNKLTVGQDGKAEFSAGTSSLGLKTLNLRAEVRNPLTGEVTDGETTYQYEVGETSVTVSADKMNVFYIGVDNPISVAAAGYSINDISVGINGGGGKVRKVGSNNYMVNVSQPGDAKVVVRNKGKQVRSVPFRVKRIPNPEARLGNKNGGNIGSGEFKAQRGVLAILEGFDFDARCNINRFEVVYVAPRQDAVLSENSGPVFNGKTGRLIGRAKPGDTYYFRDVRAKCPGDKNTRKINDMVFNIR